MKTIDELAAIQHEIWSHWMRYLFSVCLEWEDDRVMIPANLVKRWKQQMNTKYADLTTKEQKSDIEQTQKIVEALKDKYVIVDKGYYNQLQRTQRY